MHSRASLRVLWRFVAYDVVIGYLILPLWGGYFPVAERNVMEPKRKEK